MGTLQQRVAAARKFLSDFGLAAYCDFGRTPPGETPRVVQYRLDAVKIAAR